MPKIDLDTAFRRKGTGYPAPHDAPCKERKLKALGLMAGLTQFGVNLVTLKPGVWSGQRHWHTKEDEFVWVLEGEATLVDDSGETPMEPGTCAGFPAGDGNGHCFQNRSESDVVLLTVGTRSDEDECHYPDIDMFAKAGRYTNPAGVFVRKDGSPIASEE